MYVHTRYLSTYVAIAFSTIAQILVAQNLVLISLLQMLYNL